MRHRRVYVTLAPYARRDYRLGGRVVGACATASCGLVVAVRGDGELHVYRVLGSEGAEELTGCRVVGELLGVGPSTLLVRQDGVLRLVTHDGCEELARAKARAALWSATGYSLALLDRRSSRLVLDTPFGLTDHKDKLLRSAERVEVGVNAAAAVAGDVLVVGPGVRHVLPRDFAGARPVYAGSGKIYLLSEDSVLYVIDEYGVVEPFSRCREPTTVVTPHSVVLICGDGLMIGKPSKLVLDYLAVASSVPAGRRAITCFPYVYDVGADAVVVYDASRTSMGLRYDPLTGPRFVDPELGVEVPVEWRDVVEEKEERGAPQLVPAVDVEKGRVVVRVEVRGAEVADAVCRANCRLIEVTPTSLSAKVIDPVRPVELDVWLRGLDEPHPLELEPPYRLLGLGRAVIRTCGGRVCVAAEGGPVLVETPQGLQVLGEGVHVVDELLSVVDAYGRVSPPRRRALHVHVDASRGRLVIEYPGLMTVKCGRPRAAEKVAEVDVLTPERCSVGLDSGEWIDFSPVELGLRAASLVAARLAELLKLREHVLADLGGSGEVDDQPARLHDLG